MYIKKEKKTCFKKATKKNPFPLVTKKLSNKITNSQLEKQEK